MEVDVCDTRRARALLAEDHLPPRQKGRPKLQYTRRHSPDLTTNPPCIARDGRTQEPSFQGYRGKTNRGEYHNRDLFKIRNSVCFGPDSYPCCILRHNNRHSEIMAMAWRHLGTELRTEGTTSSILGLIEGMAGGRTPHQADALIFGLYTALRLKDPDDSRLARLKCAEKKCQSHDKPVSHRSLRGEVRCAQCGTAGMVCADCGHARVDHCTWCKGCRKMFK